MKRITGVRKTVALGATLTLAAVLSACSNGSSSAGGSKTLNWWTWDDKQAAAYKVCATDFEKANPGVTVKITQYNVADYFTKLTAGFVAGNAPDAFQNSVQYFQAYASQHQLLPLDDFISKDKFDLSRFSVGVNAWKFTDGKQYALPLDWAATGIYYNEDALKKAGYAEKDVDSMTWNPDDGGTLGKMIAHMTIDDKGRRGDEKGFDKSHVKTYGYGEVAAKDFIGQTTWSPLVDTTGWRLGDKSSWPTVFNYDDPQFVKTMHWIRSLTDKGFAPRIGQFTDSVSDVDLLSSGKVAMESAGSWEAATFVKVPGLKVGIAPTPYGPDGKTRAVLSNSNGNNIWAGTKNPDLAWKWVSYMGSEACQSKASQTGTFFPSIPASMDASAKALATKGVDLSVFTDMMKNKVLYPSPVYGNGAALQDALEPLFQAYFAGQKGDSVFTEMQSKSKQLLAKN
ncbi:sugar ABC transporter substrate-binding protein [Streptomyces spinosirectus]|jgi:multiple sugar transport system substrate-binding protein|uniref:ABC transporter substrate-binding protein n=1 Tax=Streptomyces TaxID=1883 RepID=UPI000FFEFD8B|nr:MULTISPECIES: sugar ABC transporter substrate-binding protein [Streptomyces]MBY8339720.1 sugar ABC transporter substrate-binding protein [Streptomyces plumbidurans]UIR15792.1 sugar ABC transporter substrate-binding protein [Streptomyces spinosirectus]